MDDDLPPRFAPDKPLPPYSYVSGRFPHPMSDPRGHSFGHVPEAGLSFSPEAWQRSPTYLHALDLFNHGYYWEAHEAWEQLWHVCGRRGAAADFLKGLIKLAAAGVKSREGRVQGVRRHALRACELFEQSQAQLPVGSQTFLGLRFDDLLEHADELASQPVIAQPTDHASERVQPVFGFRLLPAFQSGAQ